MSLANKVKNTIIGTSLAIAVAITPKYALADVEYGNFPISDTTSARFIAEEVEDRLGKIPGDETLFKLYMREDGSFFGTYEMTVDGTIYAWTEETTGDTSMDWFYLAHKNEGLFSRKTPAEGKFNTPQWMLDKYLLGKK